MKGPGNRCSRRSRREGKALPWTPNLDPSANQVGCVGRDGKTKRSYIDRHQARDIAKAQRLTRHDDRIRAYRCPSCGAYHVGHDKRID